MLDKYKKDKTKLNEIFQQLTNATIMIVDDEPTTMEVVKIFLEEAGFHKFILVEKPSEAMKVLEETSPDILVLDIIMPEVSGFDILLKIRAHPKFKNMPIIIMTTLSDTESKLRALELGATDFLTKPLDKNELCLRMLNTLAVKAYHDQMSSYDPLTTLSNKLFRGHLDWALKEAKRYKEHLAVLNIEIDNFDKINTTIGSSAGNEILRQTYDRIKTVIRSVDKLGRPIEDADTQMSLFRIQGSSFSLLLHRIRNEGDAAIVANRIIQSIRNPMQIDGTDIFVTVSIGIATYPATSNDIASLMQHSSNAKDFVKNSGGNTFQFSSIEINAIYKKRLILENRLRKSLERKEFILHYQPKMDIRTNAIIGVEALLRWNCGENDLVLPNDFIPLAEETGLIVPIGEWVLHEACTQLKKWHETCKVPISISVNLSAQQFTNPGLFSTIKRIIESSGIDPEFLTLELTESLLLEDIKSKINILKRLKDMGIKLSIDDFGTGYSSLMYLNKLPVDELKIDRLFITDMVDNSNNRSIIESVIFLAHRLGLITVAEGVETKEQLQILEKDRCNQYQGFLFSRPLPNTELFEMLRLLNEMKETESNLS